MDLAGVFSIKAEFGENESERRSVEKVPVSARPDFGSASSRGVENPVFLTEASEVDYAKEASNS